MNARSVATYINTPAPDVMYMNKGREPEVEPEPGGGEWKMGSKKKGAKSRVFPIASGSARDSLREINKRLRTEDADFPCPTLHALRHTFASAMACRGVAPKLLQAWMGHSSIAMTLEVYAKVMPDAEARVIEEKLAGFGGV